MNVLQRYLGGKMAAQGPQMGMSGAVPGAQNPMAAAAGGGGDPGGRLLSDLMRDFGLTAEQAAGFVGNLDYESGGFKSLQEIKPMVEGSQGGYGYAQWTGPRRKAFEAWAAQNGLDPASYDANYGFLRHELTSTPEGAVIGKLRGAGSVDDAARIVSETFLRPGIVNMNGRVERARRYANPMAGYVG